MYRVQRKNLSSLQSLIYEESGKNKQKKNIFIFSKTLTFTVLGFVCCNQCIKTFHLNEQMTLYVDLNFCHTMGGIRFFT